MQERVREDFGARMEEFYQGKRRSEKLVYNQNAQESELRKCWLHGVTTFGDKQLAGSVRKKVTLATHM